ncbi:MAG TPA: MFS transporter [Xanthobacteraceae bacterium]|nr:MFS transporter [Xanthobacteraceae bacterium]
MLLALFLAALDQTIVATALPTIAENLGDVENLSWVVTIYLLASTVAGPLYGKLSDIHGRRAMMLLGIGLFALGSVACALAPSMLTLILARALQGAGGGGLIPMAQTVIADVVSPRERARFQAYTSTTFLSATIGGPLLGGLITEYLHWSVIFWINVPLAAVGFLLTRNVLRLLPRHDRPHRLDLLGAGLMVTASIAVMLALTWGGRHFPWGSPQILGLLCGSALLWGLFWVRTVTAPEPFIPVAVLRNPVVGTGTGAAFFGVGTIVGLTIVLPIYLQLALGLSVSGSGLAVIAYLGGATVSSMVAGRLLARLVRYKRVPIVGLLIALAAFAVLAVDPVGLPVPVIFVLILAAGLGLGPMFPVTIVLVQNAVALHELGIATGISGFARSLGGTFVVAVLGAIVLTGVPGGATELSTSGLAPIAVAGAFRWVFLASAICLVISFGFVLAMEERPLRGPAPPVAVE